MKPTEFVQRLRTVRMCAHSFAQVLDLFLEYDRETAEKRERNANRMRTVRAQCKAQSRTDENNAVVLLTNLSSSKPLKDFKKEKKEVVARGSCITEKFQPSEDSLNWAMAEFGIDRATAKNITDEFRDFWSAVPGAKGRKLDWDKTWKNRIRELYRRRKVNGTHLQRVDGKRSFQDVGRDIYQRLCESDDEGIPEVVHPPSH